MVGRVDLGGQQGDGHVLGRRLGVVPGRVEQLDHREVVVEGVGVLDVADRAVGIALGDVAGHAEVTGLGDHPLGSVGKNEVGPQAGARPDAEQKEFHKDGYWLIIHSESS